MIMFNENEKVSLEKWQCQSRDKYGRLFTSTHNTKAEAQASADCCRGRYPYGNRVKVVRLEEPTIEKIP